MKRLLLLLLVLLLAACGTDGGEDAEPTVTSTQFPTFSFTQPTEAPQVATAAANAAATNTAMAESGEVVLDPVMVERGQGRYEALECASCHGEDGEGNEEGPALTDWEQSQDEFIDFMRTGGEMGDDHRFPVERLSESGIENLYQYLLSLDT